MSVKALGKDKVFAVSMPCSSVKSDIDDARLVTEKFGVQLITVDLQESFETLKNEINNNLGDNKLSKEALINIKPRLRMTTLYSVAQSLGYLVIRNRKSLRRNGSGIQLNGEIVVLTLIQLLILQ